MAIGDPERATQNRMIAQLCGDTSGRLGGLGWRYLGDWQQREGPPPQGFLRHPRRHI